MRVARWLLLGLGLIICRVFAPTYQVLAELLVAACVSVWAFAPEERPLVHEAHELGVGPRAFLQGVVCTAVYLGISPERAIHGMPGWPDCKRVAIETIAFSVVVIPAWVETRERANARRLSRDLWGSILMLVAGFVALELYNLAFTYTTGLDYTHSIQGALSLTGESLGAKLHRLDLHRDYCWLALLFVGPSLARFHEARPRTVLVVAVVGAALAVSSSHALPYEDDKGRGRFPGELFDEVPAYLPFAYALSLGPAFADKLVRKIERRLPKSHSHD